MTKEEKQLINEARESLMFCYNLRYRDDFFYEDSEAAREIDGYYFRMSDKYLYMRKPGFSVLVQINWGSEHLIDMKMLIAHKYL